MLNKVQKFVTEVAVELKKVSWSTKKELIDSTWVILISATFLGIIVGIADFLLSRILAFIIH